MEDAPFTEVSGERGISRRELLKRGRCRGRKPTLAGLGVGPRKRCQVRSTPFAGSRPAAPSR